MVSVSWHTLKHSLLQQHVCAFVPMILHVVLPQKDCRQLSWQWAAYWVAWCVCLTKAQLKAAAQVPSCFCADLYMRVLSLQVYRVDLLTCKDGFTTTDTNGTASFEEGTLALYTIDPSSSCKDQSTGKTLR
jgi:hypothetical protein